MSPIVTTATVGPDGTLTLALPPEAAGQTVRVTVNPAPKPMTQEEWSAWVLSTAGTWQGEFERPPQDEYEEREPLS
jgi:hypothetical protein